MTDWGNIGTIIGSAIGAAVAAAVAAFKLGTRKGASVPETPANGNGNGQKPGNNWLEEVRRVVGEVVSAAETRLRGEIQAGMTEMRGDRANLWGEINKGKENDARQDVEIAVLKEKARGDH